VERERPRDQSIIFFSQILVKITMHKYAKYFLYYCDSYNVVLGGDSDCLKKKKKKNIYLQSHVHQIKLK